MQAKPGSFAGWVEGVGYVILADSCYVVSTFQIAQRITLTTKIQRLRSVAAGSTAHIIQDISSSLEFA